MKGDIAVAGFLLTAEEWQELDAQSRAQLIAVVTRRADPWLVLEMPERFAEGTGPHEALEVVELELEPDPES